MLKNYFTVAWRNLVRQPGYTALNLLGLTIGISSSLIILLYLQNELGYDSQHERADRIVRISSDLHEPDDAFRWAVTQIPLGPMLKQTYPEVEHTVRFSGNGNTTVQIGDQVFVEEDFYLVDSTVFQIFTYPLIEGDPITALTQPNSIVLDRSLAEKYFGPGGNWIGKTFRLDGEQDVTVTGVMEDVAVNSHIIPRALMAANGVEYMQDDNFGGFNLYTYALLHPDTDIPTFEKKLTQIVTEHVDPIFEQYNIQINYEVLPIKTIHLYSDFLGEPGTPGNIQYVWVFAIVGLFMLIIACINYMNLATARSAKRAREVGVRKALGSWRSQLIAQFLTESILITFMAMILSLGIVWAAIIPLNAALGTTLSISTLFSWKILTVLLLIMTVVGLVSGSYPAFLLSKAEPATVLKGGAATIGGGGNLRKALVFVQFSISLGLLVCTGIVFDQLRYLQETDLGFTKSPVLRFSLAQGDLREKWPVLAEKFKQIPGVESVATGNSSPGNGYGKNLTPIETNEGDMVERGLNFFSVDPDYIPTLDMQIILGRNFDLTKPTDTIEAAIVNEAMVKRMGWDDPIGKKINLGFAFGDSTRPFTRVIGVIKDYHHQSLYHEIEDLMFLPAINCRIAHLRIAPAQVKTAMPMIEAAFASVAPTIPFESEFVDEDFQSQYEEDERRSRIFTMFSILTILIACLGLLGLASYTAEQRTKEIGVRKVLGASTNQLVALLTKDFLLLVSLSMVVAFPLSWWLMNNWLESFAYSITPAIGTFVSALILTLMITLATTSFHAIRTARANPVFALKSE